MGHMNTNLRTLLIGGMFAAAMTACAPASQVKTQGAYHQGGYSQSAYAYQGAQESQTTYRSRYGDTLRGSCDIEIQTCGFMTVVPVYPVFQIVTAPPAPDVPVTVEAPPAYTPEPMPEPPVVILPPEPEPPAYVPPVQHWPEPTTPPPVWTPPRK